MLCSRPTSFEGHLMSKGSTNTTQSSREQECPCCGQRMPADCFRKHAKRGVRCQWKVVESGQRLATATSSSAQSQGQDSQAEFIKWYAEQPDRCSFCHRTFHEFKKLRIRQRRGYRVARVIDRLDSTRLYESDNLALACFVCNPAKGDRLSPDEARTIGRTRGGCGKPGCKRLTADHDF
jgi:hypothetical protein